jgi:YVTN family beta-propeller protein
MKYLLNILLLLIIPLLLQGQKYYVTDSSRTYYITDSSVTYYIYYDLPGAALMHLNGNVSTINNKIDTVFDENNHYNAIQTDTSKSPSLVDGSWQFDGIDDYVEVADNNNLDLQNNFTVSAWVNANGISGAPQGILSKGNYSLKEYDDDYIFEVLGDGTTWSKSGDVGNTPFGLAAYDGKLYIACRYSDDVYVFDGTSWSKSGNVGDEPFGLAVYDSKLYTVCQYSDDVYVFDGTSWSKSGDVGNDPRGLAVYDGNLYVACFGSDDIYVFDGTSWSKSGNVGTSPRGLAAYGGKLYTACAGSNDVYVFDGTTWTKSGDVGDTPLGLAVYNGKLYVTNAGSNDIYVFDGTSWTKSGDVGNAPFGLAVYNGKLYVTCVISNDIYVFDGTSWTKSGNVGDFPRGSTTYDGKLYVTCSGSDDVSVFSTGESLWASKGTGYEQLIGVVTGDEIKLYVNGEEKASTAHSLTFDNNDNSLLIGKSYGSSQSGLTGGNSEVFNGSIDEVIIFDRALIKNEVQELYNSCDTTGGVLNCNY